MAGEVSHMFKSTRIIARTLQGDDIAHAAAKAQITEADVYHILDMIHTSFLEHHGEDHPMLGLLSDFMERVSADFRIET